MNNDALVAKIDVDRRQFRSTRTSMQTESHTLKKEKELRYGHLGEDSSGEEEVDGK